MDGVAVPDVRGLGAGGAWAPALLLQERLAVRVHFVTDRVGRADGQVGVILLQQKRREARGGRRGWIRLQEKARYSHPSYCSLN